ncbi:MAG TPA: tripartite tricarboxylate transporter substrate binding protein, partial [Burkholderiales bacterium]|nr:tripartite tricarboxylate transporter substrate binding protein [Burkholderiales bacterium]
APTGTAADRMTLINAAVNKILASADMKKFLNARSTEPWPLSVAELSDLLPKEIERYKEMAKAAGIPAQ